MAASTLSRLESGARRLALDHLTPLARALGVDVGDLLAPATADPRVREQSRIVEGIVFRPLSRHAPGGLVVARMDFPAERSDPDPRSHEGHEWLYVLSGMLRLVLGDDDLILEPGEAAEFSTWTPHWMGAVDGPASAAGDLRPAGPARASAYVAGTTSRVLVGREEACLYAGRVSWRRGRLPWGSRDGSRPGRRQGTATTIGGGSRRPTCGGRCDQVDARSLQRYDRALVGFGTRHTLSTQTDPKRGIGAARDYIKRQFDADRRRPSGGRMTVELQSYVQPPAVADPDADDDHERRRDAARAPTRQSADRVYVVGGHYDSRVTDVLNATADAPGANDDGSGTSAVLELARVMAPRPTEATIVFVAFAGEEQGLYGSNHFAEVAKQNELEHPGRPEHGHHRQPGRRQRRARRPARSGCSPRACRPARRRAQTARRQSIGGENDGVSRQLARYVKETGENDATGMHVKLVWRRDRFLRGGDQIPFLQRGWPAVRFTEPNENFDHQHQDVRVENGKQFGDLLAVRRLPLPRARHPRGRLVAGRAGPLAARAGQRARASPPTSTYDTELRWNANPEPDVVGYEVVWRDSTEPLWTHSRRVGNVTEYTIEGLNKDDYQVGVRAIDRDGNRSPVAYPIPASA